MATRRHVLKTLAAASVATAILGVENVMATNTELNWKHFPAGETGFFRAPVLIEGAREALLIEKREVAHVPLHQQPVVWASRRNIGLAQSPDNRLRLRYVQVN